MANYKEQLVNDFKAKIAEINGICTKATNAELEEKFAELKKMETEYRSIKEKEVFNSLEDVHAALVMHHFETIHHKPIKEDGRLVSVEEDLRNVTIDLRKYCDHKGFSTEWFWDLQALNKRLTLKVATDLGVTARELKAIDSSYAMDKLAAQIALGETPTSDNQCVKHMQKVLDSLSPSEGRVNKHDLAYIMLCYAKKNNKTALRVVCSKHSILQGYLTDVFHRVAIGGSYGVDYKAVIEPERVSEPETKTPVKNPKKVSKTETVVVKKEEQTA